MATNPEDLVILEPSTSVRVFQWNNLIINNNLPFPIALDFSHTKFMEPLIAIISAPQSQSSDSKVEDKKVVKKVKK